MYGVLENLEIMESGQYNNMAAYENLDLKMEVKRTGTIDIDNGLKDLGQDAAVMKMIIALLKSSSEELEMKG